jgi:hypothetical protein
MTKAQWSVLKWTLLWIARAASLTSAAIILLFFVGFQPGRVALREWIGLAFFPIGVVVGFVIAWWKEGLGGGVALVSLLAFYGIYGFLMGSHIGGWAFIVFSSPGFLFLAYWLIAQDKVEVSKLNHG